MKTHLLYWGRSWNELRRHASACETHSYAQLEICVRGRIAVRGNEEVIRLNAGDCLLIPPNLPHSCFYPEAEHEFYSLKFARSALPNHLLLCRGNDFTRWFAAGLRCCHAPEQRLAMPLNDANREIIEGSTEMLLEHMMRSVHAPETPAEPPVFAEIRNAVLCSGASINVESCAEAMGINAAQLNYRFAKERKAFHLSARDWSVKRVIDQAKIHQINQYLDYTELAISEIARQMQFNNIYTFSRFYRRLAGCSPRERRRGTSRREGSGPRGDD